MFINLAATFAPLIFSSGSVLIMARVYQQRVSRVAAIWSIVVWCACESSTGLSLLLYLHAMQLDEYSRNVNVTMVMVPFLFATWIVVSYSLYNKHYVAAVVASVANFCAHIVVVGLALAESGVGAALLGVIGAVWICWTLCFSLSILLFVRRKLMQPISERVLAKMRADAMRFSFRRKQAQQAKNV